MQVVPVVPSVEGDPAAGEEVFAQVQKAFFGPFRVSVMLDSNGCNTTAATAIR